MKVVKTITIVLLSLPLLPQETQSFEVIVALPDSLLSYRVLLHHDSRLMVQEQRHHFGMIILCGVMKWGLSFLSTKRKRLKSEAAKSYKLLYLLLIRNRNRCKVLKGS